MKSIPEIKKNFLKSVENIELTEEEQHTVKWLSNCEWQTLINLTSIISKAKTRDSKSSKLE